MQEMATGDSFQQFCKLSNLVCAVLALELLSFLPATPLSHILLVYTVV